MPPVEVLELLDRVGRLADPQPLPHDGEQVDEPLPPQQRVELGLAGAVPPGEPLQRGLLVGRVVVDVHVRVGGQPAGQLVEQVAGQRRLLVVVVRPPGAEPSAAVPQPGEVLPALAVGGERVALEVEVDVARAGRRQAQQPAVGLGRQQLVGGPAGGPLAHLQARLLGQPLTGRPADRAGQLGHRGCGQRLDGGQSRGDEGVAVPRAHAGDERQVVGLLPPGGAVRGPAALRAVRHRSRVGVGAGLDRLLQAGPGAPRVGRDVVQPPGTLHPVAGHHGEPLRRDALEHGQPLGVGRHLQQRRHLEPAGQLGVGDVVGPVAEVAGPVGAQQEVGLAAPPAVEERRLVDHVDARAHRRERLGLGLPPALEVEAGRDLGHAQAGGAQALQVGALVLGPLAEDQLQRVVRRGGAAASRGRPHGRPARAGRAWSRAAQARCLVRSVGLSNS